MPRGVAIPDLRERLFLATERLLAREGPGALSSRAVTSEAGCAKGVLHNHFPDFDGFLAEFVLDRFRHAVADLIRLPEQAGTGTVAQNLTNSAALMFGSNVLSLASMVIPRPALVLRIRDLTVHNRSRPMPDLERSFAAYLEAEKKLGRIPASADTATIALTLVATAHHLFLTHRVDSATPHDQLRRIVDTLLGHP